MIVCEQCKTAISALANDCPEPVYCNECYWELKDKISKLQKDNKTKDQEIKVLRNNVKVVAEWNN